MQIEALRDRVFTLLGQLDEAKRVYEEALKEVNAKNEADKKQTTSKPTKEPKPSN